KSQPFRRRSRRNDRLRRNPSDGAAFRRSIERDRERGAVSHHDLGRQPGPALAKAARLAERLHADVELVEPMRNLPMAQVMPLAEEPAEDAAQARGSDGAE